MIDNKSWTRLLGAVAGSLLLATGAFAQCYVKLYDSEGFEGQSAIFLGPGVDPSLNDNRWSASGTIIGDDTDSLETGPDAFFEGFEEPNFGGTAIRVLPNTRIADINAAGGNDIESYKLYDRKPHHWQ